MNPASCRCAVKKLLTENNADVCWHERQSSRNAKYDRSLPRSKYVETRARHAFMQKSSFMLAAIKLKLFRCSCAKNTVNALYRYRETEEYLYPLFGNVNTLKFVALWVVSNLVAVADKEKFEGCRGKRYNVRGLHCNRWDGRRLMQELVSIFNKNFSFLRHCMLKCDIRILILRRLRFLWAKDLFELRGSKLESSMVKKTIGLFYEILLLCKRHDFLDTGIIMALIFKIDTENLHNYQLLFWVKAFASVTVSYISSIDYYVDSIFK